MAFENYNGLLWKLRKAYPETKVHVKRVEFKEEERLLGSCQWIERKKKFRILIEKNISSDFACWVLIHEWAHAVAWNPPGGWHGPEWGEAYSVCYRIWADEIRRVG